jgi:saccharopine dehydrogenase-like NADP-dependent oxidoreductase
MIAKLLVECGDYDVLVADHQQAALDRLEEQSKVTTVQVNATKRDDRQAVLKGRDSVISALSFRFNPLIAKTAVAAGVNYFDLTEDIETTRKVRAIVKSAAPKSIVMPQCGLAPGFISIVANKLTQQFDKLDTVHMRVGALPQFPSNAMKYNLTWSTDGLINEYCNPCEAIHDHRQIEVLPLEGLQTFSLNGARYEAFNTSGGLGTLCESLSGKVRELNYKTIRYVGHRDLMAFLVNELQLSSRREILKDILESSTPVTFQDVVVIFCNVTGWRNGQLVQISDARNVYSMESAGEPWSAIQITTAAAVCAVVDLHVAGELPQEGFVRQEDVDYDKFLGNRFGKYYANAVPTGNDTA